MAAPLDLPQPTPTEAAEGTQALGEASATAATLAHDDHDAALAGLVLGKTTIAAIGFIIGRANVAAEIGAVHFDLAGNGLAVRLRGECFADLVGHHESGLVLAIQVAT